ncbi:ferredoxin Fer [Haladaptatus sp. CMAA 1911]|uniref:ferredoxin Fer n=1 Tax=unclassified Haladaptatus TaxID=2622732 RepID=UPI003754D8E4
MNSDFDLPKVGPGADSADEDDAEAPDESPATIEYLDYRVVDINDWDIETDDIFEMAANADLPESQYGVIDVDRNDSLLQSAESEGLKWPFQCRSGTCARCSAILVAGEAQMDMNLFLDDDEVNEMDYRLTCTCRPESDDVRIVFNAIHSEYIRKIAQDRG